MQAGLQLKNVIYSNELEQKAINQNRWLALAADVRQQIKINCFTALGTQEQGFHSAAQCVAYMACAEIPTNQWPDVMQLLVQNITGPQSNEALKQASLEAIGYICNDIDPNILATQADHILTGIIYGMKKEEPSNKVRLAATQALLNSLEFTRQNFDNENERNYIMQVVCEGTQCPDTAISVVALQCLVKIMSHYYMYMELYMQRALFAITVEAMKSTVDSVVLQGIEFWSSVCEEEIELALEHAEAQEHSAAAGGSSGSSGAVGGGPTNHSKYYARGAVKFLVPLLLEILEKQEEGDDEDEWNPHKAAGVCLALLSQACEEAIVELVLPYVQAFIRHEDWRRRDAAVMAFGSILEGPAPHSLEGLVTQAMPVITELLADPVSVVRDTAAWTVGRVCEVLPEVPLGDACLPALLHAMVTALSSEAKVATNVCWAFSSLAEGAYTVEMRSTANLDGDGQPCEPRSYKLSPYFSNIVEQLLLTTNRPDCGQANLRNAAYSALMEMVKSAPKDCYPCIQHTTMVVLQKLDGILQMDQAALSSQDRTQLAEYQSLLCGTLQSVLRKIERGDAQNIADQIMSVLMVMFDRAQNGSGGGSGGSASRYAGVQEDALIAVNALIDAIGPAFSKYLTHFMGILVACLNNVTEQQICSSAVGILGDLARSVTVELVPYLDEIFNILFGTLRNPSTQRSLLPLIISTFSDFALLLGDNFATYRPQVLDTLKQACQAEVDMNDPDMIDYLNLLRQSCVETFVGLIQGAKSPYPQENIARLDFIIPHMPFIVTFVEHIGAQPVSSEELIGSCCGLVGDIATGFGKDSIQILDTEGIRALLARGRNLKNASTKKYAVWAVRELTKLRNQ